MRFTPARLACLFACGWAWAGTAAAAIPNTVVPAADSGAQVLPISNNGFAGSSVNVLAGLQYTLFTDEDRQYAAFYDADGTLVLARRTLGQDRWETARTPYQGDVADAHKAIAMVVDGDGFLHVAWGHHAEPLNYAISTVPGALRLGPKLSMTGRRENRVTYPSFLRLPDGDLLFLYRDGVSGRGDLVLNRYFTREKTWRRVQENLLDGEGRCNAYDSASVDAHGTLHLAWTWRESPDVSTNHDLCYARSADGGQTWMTSAGAPQTVPITAENAEYVLRIPERHSLMNPPSVAADAEGRPYLADYWAPEGSAVPQYFLVRREGKTWVATQVTQRTTPFTLAGAATKHPPLSRSLIFLSETPGAPTAVYLVYRDDERGSEIMVATGADTAQPSWTFRALTAGSVGAWEPSADPVAWARFRQIEMLVQPVEQNDGDDRRAPSVPPTTVSALRWTPPDAGGTPPAPTGHP
jgi:hypothetical protein